MNETQPSVPALDSRSVMPENFKTLLFSDEVKFHINNGGLETATYFFGVAVKREQVFSINEQFNNLIAKHNIKVPVFHATRVFNEKHPRLNFMNDVTDMLIANELHFFIFRYDYDKLFEVTKQYGNHLNREGLFNFGNPDFQALFYYLMMLNTTLRDSYPELIAKDIAGYFDRNVYGVKDVEAFIANSSDFIMQRMTHCEKKRVSLLALPDFVGFLFHRSKRSMNSMRANSSYIETSELTENCYQALTKTAKAGIFHFLDIEPFYSNMDRLLSGFSRR